MSLINLALVQHQRRHQQVFEPMPTQLILEGPTDEESGEEDMSDSMSQFQTDEDGTVV